MNTDTVTLWKVDASHSEVQFKVKHLVISTVTGSFNSFSGTVETGESGFEDASISFEADIDSISTGDKDRDDHLKSEDFFNAEHHPKLSFKSTSFEKVADSNYKMTGDITIAGNTNEITLDVVHGGIATGPQGNTRAGFDLNGKISRKEFGLTWNPVTEAGSVVVGDEIKLLISVQLVKS
ncbi:MAG TPA: YceI family protein [Fodinibius sp.]|nr:YceI family protein [Fodinibius sp.]